ncbi:LEM-3-like GIY-YIG domain-containing protein [Flavobacterium psychrotrophum]|uniref:LEM-3-like GIY-YIG domain-containing protein n=1 Tax=Flavobacterium psychrotrophum TaxID=2294119 RepID=UPI0019690432|nr:hypothetical protein [Flavobacterium psychrotrophum]
MYKKFPEEVIVQLKNYVYRLIDPRNNETFYVGRGVGNRIFQHAAGALKLVEETNEDEISLKLSRILEIHKEGLEVIHMVHRHGLDQNSAVDVEAALIDIYTEATNINSGSGLEFGLSSTDEIIIRYAAETAELNHEVVMITINKTANNLSIYDAVRFAWKIDVERANKAKYILAVDKGIIRGVYIAKEWKLARKQYFPNFTNHTNSRYGFHGDEADDDIKKMYIGKRIPDEFRKRGAAYPIKYNFKK